MKKQNLAAIAALALTFVGGLTVRAAEPADGHIYEFRPITPVNTVDPESVFGAAKTIQFKMRLVTPTENPQTVLPAARHRWEIYFKGDPSLTPDEIYWQWLAAPLNIGVVVSGRIQPAKLSLPVPYDAQRYFTDFTCEYTTKFGDLALPIKLAMPGGRYVFGNDHLWGIRDADAFAADGTIIEPVMMRSASAKVPIPENPRNGSIDIAWGFGGADDASQAYFVKTLGFDDQTYTDADETVYWRGVSQGDCEYVPDVPTIRFDAMPEVSDGAYDLYVWSEDDSAVTLKFSDNADVLKAAGVFKTNMLDRTRTSREFWVRKIHIDGATVAPTFDMKGVTEGQAATLVLSPEPGYRFHNSEDLLNDFLTVRVMCTAPAKPRVSVRILSTNTADADTAQVNPYDRVSTRVATLEVRLNRPYEDGDLTVTVLPKLAIDGEPGESALGYFGLSTKTETQSYLDKTATNVTFSAELKEVSKTIYLYAWGADAKTFDVGKSVAFVPSVADPVAAAHFTGGFENAFLFVKPMKPVVVEPVADQLVSVNCSVPYSLTIKVSDTYNDMKSDAGYELWFKKDVSSDLEFTKYEEKGETVLFKPDADGVLYSIPAEAGVDGHLPQITWENTATETAAFYLKSPMSGQKSEERQIKLYVKPARQIGITTTDGKEGNQYVEGDPVNVTIELLNAKNDTGADIWAFLVPQGEATNAVNASWTAAAGKTGRRIPKGDNIAKGTFTLFDGTSETPQGGMFDFKIELRTAERYDDPDGKPVPGFESKSLTLYSRNVIPSVDFIEMDYGVDTVTEDGGTIGTPVAKGIETVFKAIVNEPGTYDKTTAVEGKKFQVRWRVTEDGKTPVVQILEGNPDELVFKYKFTKASEKPAKVEVDLQDKDMGRFGNGELNKKFTFYVTVLANPQITVSTASGVTGFTETDPQSDAGAEINVDLSLNPVDLPLVVELEVVPPSANPKDNPGQFILLESDVCKRMSENVYRVLFDGAVRQTIGVETLDGTALSRSTGFSFKTKVLGVLESGTLESGTIDADYPYPNVPGETCASYYIGRTGNIKVLNAPPQFDLDVIYPQPDTTNKCAIGTLAKEDAIYWAFTDVLPDFSNQIKGITLTIKGEGETFTTNVVSPSAASGYFQPTFKTSGLKIVTMSVRDKDEGSPASITWYYDVAVSKTFIATPHGPTGGKGGANAKRYQTAAGLGEGHVYAGEPATVSGFESTYNCQIEKRWTVWGFGYKVGCVDDGKLNDGRDFALTTKGAPAAADLPKESYYAYPKYVDKNKNPVDSFLYTWLQIVSEEDSATLNDTILGNTLSPEYAAISADAGTTVGLPTEAADDGGYDDTMVEAIFAREYLASDNMGDINQDGVPDIYVAKYGLGVVDTVTGQISGDDLESKAGFNEDEDALPGDATAYLGSYIPGLKETWTRKFTADLEIRGYGPALNDAPIQLGIQGVKPDCVYEDPDLSPTSTLSKVEWLAWSEYKAANPTATVEDWSPERPTDPSKADTDEDGFDDGFEYYYWYLAHVGYIDANGVHRRLTGRAYDPRNPGEGRLITSEEIESVMDPQVKYVGADADSRDTDGDGLPDLLEFEIGTNPFDFDTDGDGLPDGWELTIAGLNPLLPGTSADALMDGERNYDGDAMAITSWKLEENVKPRDLDVDRIRLWTFATIDPTGDTDGVQWYATKAEPETAVVNAEKAVWSFKSGDRYYVSFEQPLATADGRLANTLKKGVLNAKGEGTGAFVSAGKPEQVTTPIEEPEPDGPTEATNYVASALYPVRLAAGLPISDISEEKVDLAVTTIKTTIAAKDANACWIYGRGSADTLAGEVAETAADYGCLALGRQLGAAKGAVVCALPSHDRDVAYLHYLVYQEFGFDPRTAWKAKDPLANRWSKTIDGEAVEGITVLKQGGYTGAPARTRDYTTYDEFLVYSFFVNNGCDMDGVTYIKGSKALEVVKAWGAFTTNPQGPNEPDAIHLEAEGAGDYYFGTINGENGADTDNDGVPDGWELYVMAGPKYKGAYVFAPPYTGFVPALAHDAYKDYEMEKSFFSPFVAAAQTTDTSNQIYLGGQINDDGLNEFKEFESTDAMNYYADYSTTVIHPGEWTWLNKFFPTDPWAKDTDGDGIDDKTEGSTFVYGTPADDGKLWSIPGGGLNPCSVDTDLDGLPDPWEKQYAGKKESLYAGELVSFAKDADGNPIGNALQGLTDGMDGTVKDAYTYPITYKANESGGTNVTTYVVVDGVNQVVNRDYDRDGLENWQEYLTGTMRCWRYDDPISPWVSIPEEWYWSEDPVTGEKSWNPDYGKFGLEDGDEDGFWYMTLVDKSSPYYNPHLITGQNPGVQYFSRVTNAWDCAYSDAVLGKGPAYYHFYDRAGNEKIEDVWVKNGPLQELVAALGKMKTAPSKYVGCSPIDDDSDHDGMDDYYELFHGMNPLLGTEGVASDDGGPFDLVFDAWYVDGSGAPSALAKDKQRNYWHRHPWKTPRAGEKDGSSDLDFTVFPWLNGRQMSDPDGDDILNDEEAIKARLSNKSWHHTDPTPLWMTDSSYPDSLVRQFFRMPTGLGEVELPESGTFTHTDEEGKETVYHFRDFDGFADAELEQRSYQGSPYSFMPFTIDAWKVCGADKMNWIFSFEENEGYDSDHDAIPDHEELESKYRSGTDPQDADSPRRRQAMYFSGPNHPSALQTMPFVAEAHPLGATTYPTDLSFLRYTVECWVMPESLEDATIVERAVYVGESNPGDQEFLRCNFRLAIKDGKWYTKFDPNGTLRGNQVEVFSSGAAKANVWTHLAATYDGEYLRLYVNGGAEVPKKSGLQPSYGSNAIAHLRKGQGFWYDREYPLKAILVGASFRTNAQGVNDGTALDVTEGRGWDRYCGFYQGYVDEIRIWDGARKPEEIKAAMDVRFDATHAKENRSAFYDSWIQGKYRYEDDGTGTDYDVPAELRFHWTFDSVPAAAVAREVATSPHGFYNGKAPLSRPDGYGIAWWQTVLDGYADTVYCDPAWVQWIPNTVTHLPRFDGTTLDSVYWSEDFMGATAGEWSFAHTAEPVSRWTQMIRNGVSANTDYKTTDSRHQMVNALAETGGRFYMLYEFTGRNLNQTGDDLLPLGGAFVKYLPTEPGVWDGQGASTTWEITGSDGDNDGLPDWWEIYVEENERKRLGRDVTIGWDTVINYHGISMTAGEAYLRDLAKGVYVDGDGKIHNDLPTEFAQTADEDFNGVPDWWAQMYGIEGESGLADHDNDGLPNYVEYLLSEVFDFKLPFSPVKWDSVTQGVPDYFHKVGELYVGEIFTDHDLVDDAWEDLYDSKYATRLAWDAFADADHDGWSNRSENRYAKQVMPIVADELAHYTAADGLVADYPIPTIALTIGYEGTGKTAVEKSPITVLMTTDGKLTGDFDATFHVGAVTDQDATTGTSSKDDEKDASGGTAYTRTIGKWSDRHALGTLTPGYINKNSVQLEFCYDPSSEVYSWKVRHYNSSLVEYWEDKRGTRAAFDADKRKYGDANVMLISKDTDYAKLEDLELRSDADSKSATWIHTKTGLTLGTIDLQSGAFDLNLGVFKGQYVVNGTNEADYASLEDQTFRIAYSVNEPFGRPRKLYLGAADEGYVREGKNKILAFADLNGDGAYTPGEPFGCATGVDVSWKGTSVEIELTETSVICPRMNIATGENDREVVWGTDSGNWTNVTEGALNGGTKTRVRVVRTMYNQSLVSGFPGLNMGIDADAANRVILDKYVDLNSWPVITEADFLSDDGFDVDWKTLKEDILSHDGFNGGKLKDLVEMHYRVVLGEGSISLAEDNNLYRVCFVRRFDAKEFRALARLLSPSESAGQIVRTAAPTFRWSMDGANTYTAFRIKVSSGNAVVYDSGYRRAAQTATTEYEWTPPDLFVGDKTPFGAIFSDKQWYTWTVSMYNSKFTSDADSGTGRFYMEVQTNGYFNGTANVAVRYFGPKDTWGKDSPTTRVRAYTSPDFTGTPIAAGYVKTPSSITNVSEEANCSVIGIPRGTYYLQAFIDSNGDGICDPWETQGYLCSRDGSTPDWLNPTAITFESKVGKGDLAIIYLEDSDTDSDGLPDAWEYVTYGSLTAKGVELITETKAGEFVVNTNLTGALVLQENTQVPTAGLAGRLAGTGLMSNAGVLALAMGAPTEGYDNFAAAIRGYVSPALVEDGVRITSLDLVDGMVSIKVEAETETAGSAWVKGSKELTVWCQVQWKQSLASTDWMDLGDPVEITVGTEEAAEIDISDRVPEGDSGYFSVKVYKK